MGVAMMKTAYSPVFNEGFDFVCALFDRSGRMIAQAEYNPSMLGAANFSVGWVLEELGADAFRPGDVWIHNDPYRGGCHLPEHMLLEGIFHEGELFGFAATIGHVAEIGGLAPGALAGDAREIYQEGLRLPPVRLMQGGDHVMDVWKIMLTNHRTPKLTWGDLHAMLGSLTLGRRRVEDLLAVRGVEGMLAATDELIRRSEAWMRRELAVIPFGDYAFEDTMENDGVTNEPRRLVVNVHVADGELIADFTGTDPQTSRPDQRDLCRHGGRDLQRRVPPHRPRDPAERGLLPADPGDRPARLARQRAAPRRRDRRQLGDALPDHRHRHGRTRPGGARARCGGRRRHRLQLPLRRRPPGERGVLRELPLRERRLGRGGDARRERRPVRSARDQPERSRSRSSRRATRG